MLARAAQGRRENLLVAQRRGNGHALGMVDEEALLRAIAQDLESAMKRAGAGLLEADAEHFGDAHALDPPPCGPACSPEFRAPPYLHVLARAAIRVWRRISPCCQLGGQFEDSAAIAVFAACPGDAEPFARSVERHHGGTRSVRAVGKRAEVVKLLIGASAHLVGHAGVLVRAAETRRSEQGSFRVDDRSEEHTSEL